MNVRFLLAVELLLVLIGGLSMQAYGASCAAARSVRINYWKDLNTGHPAAAADLKRQNEWAFRGECGSYDMYSYGDYDQSHHWHDSDWWVGHDRNWVQQHHPTWMAEGEHHDNGQVKNVYGQNSKNVHGQNQGHDQNQSHGQNQGHGQN